MKVNELWESEQLDEITRPYGVTAQLKDKITGGVKGAFGGGQAEQGNAVAGRIANKYFNELKKYIGRTMGTGVSEIPYEVLFKFMSGSKLGTDALTSAKSTYYTPSEAADVIFAAARAKQDEFAELAPQPDPDAPAQEKPSPAPSAPTPVQPVKQKVEPTMSSPVGNNAASTTGSEFAGILSKMKDADLRKLASLL